MVYEINSMEEFEKNIIGETKTVLVDFYAKWCGPCSLMHPIVDKIASENTQIKVVKVDIDNVKELAQKYEITSIPTFLIFKNGEMVQNLVGTQDEKDLLEFLK